MDTSYEWGEAKKRCRCTENRFISDPHSDASRSGSRVKSGGSCKDVGIRAQFVAL